MQLVGTADTTPPAPGTVTASNTQFGTFVSGTFDVTATFTDSESAVTGCEYTTNGGTTWAPATVSGGVPNFTCSKTGITGTDGQALSLNMRATSGGGTAPATAIARTVDAAPPTTTSNAPAGWVATDQTVTLSASDGSGSGVASTQYCTDSNTCTPSAVGTSVSVTCGAGTACQRYVRFRSMDNVGNVEGIKSIQVQIDKAAPAAVTNLAAGAATQTTVPLTWSNPADSGSGNASFDLRYRIGSTFGAADWAGATQAASEPTPPATGMTVSGLSCGTTYTFALKTKDQTGNESPLSNVATRATAACPNNPPNTPTNTTPAPGALSTQPGPHADAPGLGLQRSGRGGHPRRESVADLQRRRDLADLG